jgi:transcriptional regulator with XRE-family HTH domain
MARKKREPGLVEQIKEAIRASGQTMYAISKASKVSTAQLSRFMQGKRSLSLPAAEKVCRILRIGLAPLPPEVPPAPKKKAKD